MNKPVVFVLGAIAGVLLQIAASEVPNLYVTLATEIQMEKQGQEGNMIKVQSEISDSKTVRFLSWLDASPRFYECFIGGHSISRQLCTAARKTFTFLTGVEPEWYKEWNGEK